MIAVIYSKSIQDVRDTLDLFGEVYLGQPWRNGATWILDGYPPDLELYSRLSQSRPANERWLIVGDSYRDIPKQLEWQIDWCFGFVTIDWWFGVTLGMWRKKDYQAGAVVAQGCTYFRGDWRKDIFV